jgi:hypothetical protein
LGHEAPSVQRNEFELDLSLSSNMVANLVRRSQPFWPDLWCVSN